MDRSKDNMRETKIYKALSYLSVYELNRFMKFVHSPYFNSNEPISKLFSFIHADLRKNKRIFNKSDIFEKLFPGTVYDDIKLRKLNSQLLDLLERFFAQEVYENNPLRQANYLLEYINNQRIKELYNSATKSATRTSKKQQVKSSLNYYYDYLLEKNLHTLREEDLKRFEETNIEKISSNLDKFFIIEKLKFYTSKVLAQKSFIQKKYTFHFIEEIKEHLQQANLDDDPVIKINYYILRMLENNEDESLFKEYKEILFQNVSLLNSAEGFDYVVEAINYSIRKINKGNLAYEKEIFDLFKFSLDTNLIIESNNFNHWDYRNICIIGLKQGEFDWVKRFNETYKKYLDVEYRDNAFTYNLGLYYFYKKQYDQVIEIFQNIEYKDPSYAINTRTLLIATYYELDETETLISFLDSFTTYISRQKHLSESKKNNYRQLIKFTRRLIHAETVSTDKLDKLKKQIQETKGVVSKPWLLEKVEDLIRQKSKTYV